jgi:parallel beta-helix repeat protein
VEGNVVNSKPLVYLESTSDVVIVDAGQVILVNCNNITVKDLDLSYTGVGIELWQTNGSRLINNEVLGNDAEIDIGAGIVLELSDNNVLAENIVSDYYIGIVLYGSSNNSVTSNNASGNTEGIYLYYTLSSNNTLADNEVSNNNYCGIEIEGGSNNTISGNTALNNNAGIFLNWANNNKVMGNFISGNIYGIELYSNSGENLIYLNNFIGNEENVYSAYLSTDSTNIWNSPEEIIYTYDGNIYMNHLGNYWDDYAGSDADGDGIGDTPYPIDSDVDNYPLVEPFENYVTGVDISVVLQGGSRPPEGWEVPITIKFFSPGADVMTDTPIYECHCTTTKSDGTATCQCVGVMPDTYDITAQASNCPQCEKGNCTLTNFKRSVVISAPSTAVDMGILLAGDANCDGIINISDFGILAVSYMCTEGEPCYDCRVDFDCNGIINISDFGLLAVNYMEMSPIDISA